MTDSHAADVQAELQTYLNSKNINSLFISIVERLLIEKPDNPIAFMIEYLHKQYPEEAQAALGVIDKGSKGAGPESKAASTAEEKAESKGIHSRQNSSSKILSRGNSQKGTLSRQQSKISQISRNNSDTDSEDEVGDSVPDMMAKPAAGILVIKRRVSVSAESMDPSKLKSQRSQLVVIDKPTEVANRLLGVVSKSGMLKRLDDDQKDEIVKAFTGPTNKDAGETIIQQGDIGDVFYLLEEGIVDVYVQKKGESSKQVHTYKAGDAFGELALMYNAPRAATCVAQSDCKLWALDRNSFRIIVVAASMLKRETYQGFLTRVPILQTLTEMEVMTLADSLLEEKYGDGDVICSQGDEGEYFYIIKEGTAVCSQVDADGEDAVVATLGGGNYFGEISLLTTKPRQATVKAQGNLMVLALDRYTFTRVLGNLDEIMKRNMEEYNKYAASALI
mmetsp:Transcript_35795/g.33907  ORF Transcript_35795/g.33907 Transcript_35795/m.33907 type:complete len:448 (+) Transcript_35795:104-1447(+)